jgi:hypothetical protein
MTRSIQAFPAAAGIPSSANLTTFAVLPDGSQIAVGFSNGAVALFSGSFLKENTSNR